MTLTLPDTAPELAISKTYHWYLNIVCDW
ncbi:MAG: DUF928 domain-containing protein [Goleter apudmare HA4340-LM2]|nr:DUF928 domain-containing protein [Goleter apudmare HA4340-LM2]